MKIRTFASPYSRRPGFMPFNHENPKYRKSPSLGSGISPNRRYAPLDLSNLSPADEDRLSGRSVIRSGRCSGWPAGYRGSRIYRGQHPQITYTVKGAPVLCPGSHACISLSHTGDYAAAIYSRRPAGRDRYRASPRPDLRVADRFMSDGGDWNARRNPALLAKLYVHWSAKEALYKLYGGAGGHPSATSSWNPLTIFAMVQDSCPLSVVARTNQGTYLSGI